MTRKHLFSDRFCYQLEEKSITKRRVDDTKGKFVKNVESGKKIVQCYGCAFILVKFFRENVYVKKKSIFIFKFGEFAGASEKLDTQPNDVAYTKHNYKVT